MDSLNPSARRSVLYWLQPQRARHISSEDYAYRQRKPRWNDVVRGEIVEVHGRSELFEFHEYEVITDRLVLFDQYGMVREFPTSQFVQRAPVEAAEDWRARRREREGQRAAEEPGWPRIVAEFGWKLLVVWLGGTVLALAFAVVAYPVLTVLEWILSILPAVLVFGWLWWVWHDR